MFSCIYTELELKQAHVDARQGCEQCAHLAVSCVDVFFLVDYSNAAKGMLEK